MILNEMYVDQVFFAGYKDRRDAVRQETVHGYLFGAPTLNKGCFRREVASRMIAIPSALFALVIYIFNYINTGVQAIFKGILSLDVCRALKAVVVVLGLTLDCLLSIILAPLFGIIAFIHPKIAMSGELYIIGKVQPLMGFLESKQ